MCLTAFGAGAGAAAGLRPSLEVDVTATDPAAPPREDVLDLLATRYYRDVDLAGPAAAPLSRLPALLDDPYTRWVTPRELETSLAADDGTYVGVGVVLATGPVAVSGSRTTSASSPALVTDVVDGSPADEAHLRDGDEVVAVDGVPASGRPLASVLAQLHGDAGAPVRLTVRGAAAGPPRTVVLVRERLRARTTTASVVLAGGHRVEWVHVLEFDAGVGDAVRRAASDARRRDTAGVVLDLRGNPGGLVDEAVTLVSAFLPEGSVVYSTRGAHVAATTYRTTLPPTAAGLPLVVLVDGETASAAEVTAAALREHGRAVVAGSTTFGKGVVQQTWPLAGGGGLKLTVAEWLTPSGNRLQHNGMDPDRLLGAGAGPEQVVGLLTAP